MSTPTGYYINPGRPEPETNTRLRNQASLVDCTDFIVLVRIPEIGKLVVAALLSLSIMKKLFSSATSKQIRPLLLSKQRKNVKHLFMSTGKKLRKKTHI